MKEGGNAECYEEQRRELAAMQEAICLSGRLLLAGEGEGRMVLGKYFVNVYESTLPDQDGGSTAQIP